MSEVSTTGTGSALVPANMREAMDLAIMMAKAGFLARELQTPGGALFVIEQAMRWNMSPFAVAMETNFIQGKPMFSGKIVAAACTSTGAILGRLDYEYEGSGDDRTVIVFGVRRGEEQVKSVRVRLKDARTANKVWITQPDQQLAHHGSRVWARRYVPEVMLGVLSPEEFDEAAPKEVPNLAAEPPPTLAPEPLPLLDSKGTLRRVSPAAWLDKVSEVLARLESADAVRQWRLAMGQYLGAVSEGNPELVAAAEIAIDARITDAEPELDAQDGEPQE